MLAAEERYSGLIKLKIVLQEQESGGFMLQSWLS